MERIKTGIIGCGNISGIYLKNLTQLFEVTEVVACADIVRERAIRSAEEFGIPKACTVEELISDPDIDIVVNLTTPGVHAEINLAAIQSGKSVYCEKPLAITREDGLNTLDAAEKRGVLLGAAPDTFLGAGLQTCRKIIDDGLIGKTIAATAFMLCHGHESWHPDPAFYYKTGGGPMFDMGPYYLTALISLMGPVSRVTGSANITFDERKITSQPKYGEIIKVDVPTHVAGILDFSNGAVATIITSFDVWHSQLPRIEIYGSEGSLMVPDPNTFGGPVYLRRHDQKEWSQVPLTHFYSENSRGLGVADMAYSILKGRENRASGKLAYHVLDIMHGFHDASLEGKHINLKSTCKRPEALGEGALKA